MFIGKFMYDCVVNSRSAVPREPIDTDLDFQFNHDEYLKIYNCLYLQTSMYNEVFCHLFNRPYLLILILGFNVTAFCTVRESTTLELAIYILFPFSALILIFLIVILSNIMASVHDKSQLAIYSLQIIVSKNPIGDKRTQIGMRMRIRAMLPLSLGIGDLFCMKRTTKLALMSFLINGTLYLLMTF